jgi:hypothetical protein
MISKSLLRTHGAALAAVVLAVKNMATTAGGWVERG